jgi:NSS family neurotransmitter:Na+ symporter
MATPQKIIYGTWSRAYAPLVIASLAGLGLAHVWEFAAVAATHGGLAFVLAWLVCMLVLGLPLRLLEIMLGKRSRRGLIDGMAYLTREADAPRFWRAAAWGALGTAIAALVGLVTLAGWGIAFIGHRFDSPTIYTAANAGPGWPIAMALVTLAAAGLNRLGLQKLAPFYFGLWVVVAGLLLMAAIPGINAAGSVLLHFNSTALGMAGWVEAARFALLALAGGLGLLWLIGAYLPPESSVGGVALPAVLLQCLLTLLVGLAFAPVVPVAATLPGQSPLLEQLPAALTSQGGLAFLLFGALALSGLAALAALGEVVERALTEKGLKPLPALLLVYGGVAAVAEALWFAGALGVQGHLLAVLRGVLLLVLLGFSVYGGWVMKISHARKELNLPSELVYNLWRVAVRLLCPLAIVAVLAGSLH